MLGVYCFTAYADLGYLDIFDLIATHEGHKTIRDPVEKLFSKIASHEPHILKCAKRFYDRLNEQRDINEPLNLSHACLSLAIGMLDRIPKYHTYQEAYANDMSA